MAGSRRWLSRRPRPAATAAGRSVATAAVWAGVRTTGPWGAPAGLTHSPWLAAVSMAMPPAAVVVDAVCHCTGTHGLGWGRR